MGKLKSDFLSPLQNNVLGNSRRISLKNKIFVGFIILAVVPFVLSTFAATVTVGTGALEFGQGSQQAIACDSTVYASVSQDWLPQPTQEDPSFGYFKVKAVTISDLDLLACRGKKLRVRLIDNQGQEISIGPAEEEKVLQITLPDSDSPAGTSDPIELQLAYLDSEGNPMADQLIATVSLNVSGTSIYDGSDLMPNAADVTFYPDSSNQFVNISGQNVGRVTVETVNNPTKRS